MVAGHGIGYWPSYNIPFYPSVYNASGYQLAVSYVGSDYSYALAPRAKIFRRDQGTVVDMESMQALMRSNGMYLGQVSCHSVLQCVANQYEKNGHYAGLSHSFWCYCCSVDYENDPYSKGDSRNAICSRDDLSPSHAANGCNDAKVTVSIEKYLYKAGSFVYSALFSAWTLSVGR